MKNNKLAGSMVILSKPCITRPANIPQDNWPYHFRQINGYNPYTKSNKKNKTDIGLPDTAIRKQSPIRQKSRILIVDDEPDIARLFKLGLERSGEFEVNVYNDPLVALSNYRPGVYDLLLLDVKMPKINGLELYQKISERDKEENGNVKVCFITAYEQYYSEFERLFPNLETDCFIRKPISIDKLVEAVKVKLD
ncbi:MAG TPA: response regulator [Nitrososphaeraceae archaeon]|nr:response regulator [Nitrososphaeraceae archaeon]